MLTKHQTLKQTHIVHTGIINSEIRQQFGDDYLGTLNDSTNMYIVGHSLGGAISQKVGAQLYESISNGNFNYTFSISSFGLNSPGSLYSSGKFSFEMESLQLTSISLLTERDVVSMVDQHSGTIQEIDCEQDFYYQCHLLTSPICEMFENCASDVAMQYDAVYDYCNGVNIGAALGAQNVSQSNYTITYQTPVQYV